MNLNAYLKLDAGGFIGPAGAAKSALSGLTGIMGSATAALAGIAGVASIAGAGLKSISSAMDAENLQVAFATMIGSATQAKETISSLVTFAKTTPFDMPEVVNSARKLLAFGTSAESLEPTLRMVGDVAAGVQAPLGDIVEIFGKARVAGKLYADDINQLTGRGIPIIQELAAQFGVSEDKVRGLVEAGKVGFPEIEKAFASLTGAGGKFHGLMDALSQTSRGLWDNLKDSIDGVFREFGKPINDALKPALTAAGGMVDVLQVKAGAMGVKVAEALGTINNIFANGEAGELLSLSLQSGLAKAINYGMAGLNAMAEGAGIVLAGDLKAGLSFLKALGTGDFWKGIGNELHAAALLFVSVIERGLAGAFESLSDIKGLGFLKGAANGLRKEATADQGQAGGLARLGAGQLQPFMQENVANIRDTAGKMMDAIKAAFSDVPKLMDDTGFDAKIRDIFAKNLPGLGPQGDDGPGSKKAGGAVTAADVIGKKTQGFEADRFTKMGLLNGITNPGADHARRTADNTSRLVTGLLTVTGLITKSLDDKKREAWAD